MAEMFGFAIGDVALEEELPACDGEVGLAEVPGLEDADGLAEVLALEDSDGLPGFGFMGEGLEAGLFVGEEFDSVDEGESVAELEPDGVVSGATGVAAGSDGVTVSAGLGSSAFHVA